MNPKFYADCPCNGCPDRTADPNCHGENGHCPHGYLEWKAEAAKKKSQFDADKKAENDATGYTIDKCGTLKRRHGWNTKKR